MNHRRAQITHSRTRRGFTLVEALIAVSIVALGMTTTLTLLTTARVMNSMEQERARARQIIYEEAERIRLDLYTHITSGRTVTIWDNGTPLDTADDSIGTLEVIVRDPDGNLVLAAPVPAVYLQVEISLSWNPRGRVSGKTLRESVMTYSAP